MDEIVGSCRSIPRGIACEGAGATRRTYLCTLRGIHTPSWYRAWAASTVRSYKGSAMHIMLARQCRSRTHCITTTVLRNAAFGALPGSHEPRPSGLIRPSSEAASGLATCCRSSTSPTRPTMSRLSGATHRVTRERTSASRLTASWPSCAWREARTLRCTATAGPRTRGRHGVGAIT
jgi:hypothetical protein